MKILFIGDSPQTNAAIKKLMTTHFIKLALVEPSEKNLLMDLLTTSGPFSFVIVVIDNPKIVVQDLYESITELIGQRPFIFIGSPTSVLNQKINEILIKSEINFLVETPLDEEEFKSPMQRAVDWVQKEEFEQSVQEFSREDLFKMRLRNFYLFHQMPFDVFLELTSTKFAKIISKDKTYSHRLIQDYSRKNIKHLYLKRDDHLKFLDTSIKKLLTIYESKLIDRSKILSLHLQSIFFIHQFIKALSVSDDIVTLTRKLIDSLQDVFKNREPLIEALDKICTSSNMTFAEYSLATAYVCDSIITNLGWSADMSSDKLFLASILQDVTLNNDDFIKIRSQHDPNFKMFSSEDQKAFMNHPKDAAYISNFFNGFSDVDFILLEHHEHPTGDGFPTGVSSSGLTTISCVFILASNFVSRLALYHDSPERFRKVHDGMKRVYATRNFKDPFKALEKALRLKKPSKPN